MMTIGPVSFPELAALISESLRRLRNWTSEKPVHGGLVAFGSGMHLSTYCRVKMSQLGYQYSSNIGGDAPGSLKEEVCTETSNIIEMPIVVAMGLFPVPAIPDSQRVREPSS